MQIKPKEFYIEYFEDGKKSVVAFNKDGFSEIKPDKIEMYLKTNIEEKAIEHVTSPQNNNEQELITQLQSENEKLKKALENSHRMISKFFKFAERVKDSKLGKFFFRKQIKELDAGSQPQLKEDSKPQDFDDIEF